MSDAAQGTSAWLFARVGNITASRFRAVTDKQKSGKPTAEREKYLMELVVERLTGMPTDHYANTAMQWGTEQETHSRMAYEARTGCIVEEVGFMRHTVPWIGGSPDGLVGEDGVWESKSPWNSAIHLATVMNGVPDEHRPQMQGLLMITGRAWCDYQSYDPRLPAPLNVFCKRVVRDEQYIATMLAELIVFNFEVEARLDMLYPAWRDLPHLNPAPQSGEAATPASVPPPVSSAGAGPSITPDQHIALTDMLAESGISATRAAKAWGVASIPQLSASAYQRAVDWIERAKEAA